MARLLVLRGLYGAGGSAETAEEYFVARSDPDREPVNRWTDEIVLHVESLSKVVKTRPEGRSGDAQCAGRSVMTGVVL